MAISKSEIQTTEGPPMRREGDLQAAWRDALLLPGETDLVESGLRELSEYLGVSREEARRACESAVGDSKREWESSPRRTSDQVVEFYRRTRSYLFEHVWWHATDVEPNAVNAELMVYAARRGAEDCLDFGSGVGSNAILFARRGFKVTLADVSETMLEFARWRLARRGLRAEFVDLNREELPPDKFDFVTAVDVCEHLSDPAAEFRRIARSLKIGGAFAFNHPVGFDEDRPMHIQMTTGPMFRAIRRNGLRAAGAEAAALRRRGFCVVERGGQSRINDWAWAVYDRARYSEMFESGHSSGNRNAPRAPHPQRIYFERVKDSLGESSAESHWLDVGCGRQLVPLWMKGQAEAEAELKSRARLVAGVDPDFSALGGNRSHAARVNADAVRLPFADGSFDLVTSNMVFEHVERPLATLREVRRVLRKGGRLIILTPNWLDIVTIAARITPNRLHPALVTRMEERGAAEVYPTYYRFNRPAAVERVLRDAGFEKWTVELLEHPDVYAHVPVVARAEAAWHALARRWRALRGVLLIEAQ
jgi:ubiquinone/menaquinone biosynthesis C-methylase UbiE